MTDKRDFDFGPKIPFWLDNMFTFSFALIGLSLISFFLEHQHAKAGALFFSGVLVMYISFKMKAQLRA